MTDPVDWKMLQAAAATAREQAYAPYSNFKVGAALLASTGRVYTGVNVENASYGLTICAERNAMAAAVTAGARHFRGMALVTQGETASSPCGACRQVLVEFDPAFEVRCFAAEGGESLVLPPGELLSHPFTPADLSKDPDGQPR